MTLAVGRRVLVDIAVIFGLVQDSMRGAREERLEESALLKLRNIVLPPRTLRCRAGLPHDCATPKTLRRSGDRSEQLSTHVPAGMYPSRSRLDNWRVGIADRDKVPFAVSDRFAE
jgi:hypothetical protein